MSLLGYEWKKMITKRANWVILLLLAVLIAYTCRNTLRQVEWTDENGNPITGHAAAMKLRNASEQWTGVLDQPFLEKALAQLKEIYSTPNQDNRHGDNNWKLRNDLQGIKHIADLFGVTYADEYESYEEMISWRACTQIHRVQRKKIGSTGYFYQLLYI